MKTYKTPFDSRVVKLLAEQFAPVHAGQKIAVLKALKFQGMPLPEDMQMENDIAAPISGFVMIWPGIQGGSEVSTGKEVFSVLSAQELMELKSKVGR